MRKLKAFVIVLFVLVLALALISCEKLTRENAPSGMKYEVYDDNGELSGYEIKSLNDDGDILRLDVYDANDEYDHYVIYEYDSDRRLIQETTYAANGIGQYYYTYEYDDDDNIIEKGYYTAEEGVVVTKYDSDGNEIEILNYDKYAEFVSRKTLEEDGKWHTYDADDKEITE